MHRTGKGDDEEEVEDHCPLVSIRSRMVPIPRPPTCTSNTMIPPFPWNITVWEYDRVSSQVESYWEESATNHHPPTSPRNKRLDPFGLVCWPGAVVAVQELLHHDQYQRYVTNQRVVIWGAGVGVEVQACAMLGAMGVIATDIHPTTLRLVQYGVARAGGIPPRNNNNNNPNSQVTTMVWDIMSEANWMIPCDLIVVADVLYNEQLAHHVARQCVNAWREHNATILITDSQKFVHHFVQDVESLLRGTEHPPVEWEPRYLPSFAGSGILVEEDQTYDVQARIMWIGKKHRDHDVG